MSVSNGEVSYQSILKHIELLTMNLVDYYTIRCHPFAEMENLTIRKTLNNVWRSLNHNISVDVLNTKTSNEMFTNIPNAEIVKRFKQN